MDPIQQALTNAIATVQGLGTSAQANIDGANQAIAQQQAIVTANEPVVSEAAAVVTALEAELAAITPAPTPTPAPAG